MTNSLNSYSKHSQSQLVTSLHLENAWEANRVDRESRRVVRVKESHQSQGDDTVSLQKQINVNHVLVGSSTRILWSEYGSHWHIFDTGISQMVCSLYRLDKVEEVVVFQNLRRAFEENEDLPEHMYLKNLERCFRFGWSRSCNQLDCNRIHICK